MTYQPRRGPSLDAVQRIHDAVRVGNLTPEQGAYLLDVWRQIQWKRRPWWERAAITIWRMIWSW